MVRATIALNWMHTHIIFKTADKKRKWSTAPFVQICGDQCGGGDANGGWVVVGFVWCHGCDSLWKM